MLGAGMRRWPGRLAIAGLAAASLGAATPWSMPARAEVDLSIAIPGVTYYTPPPAFSYASSHWYQPVVGGVYLGFGQYHHHYW